jgi:thiol-disulfide isomerase/thioredoxin
VNPKIFFLLAGHLFAGLGFSAQVELVGPLTREKILAALPEWKALVEVYSPDLDTVGRLRAIREGVEIEVFLGTWCPDCRQHVSAFFKVMDVAQNPLIRATYTGIPRAREDREKYTAGKNIERVPTFIVRYRNQEAGRIIETPRLSVEGDLWEILRKITGSR